MLKRTAAFTLVSLAALAGVASSSRAEGMAAPAQGVMVAFGDSQTWGVGATQDHHHRWTDQLEARLRADPALAGVSVINAGINGNRLLNDGKEPFLGPSGLSRFDKVGHVQHIPVALVQRSHARQAVAALPHQEGHQQAAVQVHVAGSME